MQHKAIILQRQYHRYQSDIRARLLGQRLRIRIAMSDRYDDTNRFSFSSLVSGCVVSAHNCYGRFRKQPCSYITGTLTKSPFYSDLTSHACQEPFLISDPASPSG